MYEILHNYLLLDGELLYMGVLMDTQDFQSTYMLPTTIKLPQSCHFSRRPFAIMAYPLEYVRTKVEKIMMSGGSC